MGRLIVEAQVTRIYGHRPTSGDGGTAGLYYPWILDDIKLIVSVINADTGSPVTGLTQKNFFATNIPPVITTDDIIDISISTVHERKIDPNDLALSGVYDVGLKVNWNNDKQGASYGLEETVGMGIQVATYKSEEIQHLPTGKMDPKLEQNSYKDNPLDKKPTYGRDLHTREQGATNPTKAEETKPDFGGPLSYKMLQKIEHQGQTIFTFTLTKVS